jgi:hypothetical protein
MTNYQSFSGVVTAIEDFWDQSSGPTGCYKLMSVRGANDNMVNFLVTPGTYFVDQEIISPGAKITGFFDADAPVPLIYPPQLRALVVALDTPGISVTVDYFNTELISSDGMLRLNISPFSQIVLQNGQPFSGNLANHDLIVIYGPTTRSVPALTTSYKIVFICGAEKA